VYKGSSAEVVCTRVANWGVSRWMETFWDRDESKVFEHCD